ncbi:MAG: hypothetical protein VX061_17110 [Pseudomonadota bacterium]|nr:hypothetical protein [Pseudomonadota bacterium]
MDKYGFGGLVRNLIKRARDDMRQTGRTTSMLERVQPNDIVVFHRHDQAKYFERMARNAGKEVRTTVVDPSDLSTLSERCPPNKWRVVLDHEWVELYIEQSVRRSCEDIAMLERDLKPAESPEFNGTW